MWIPPSCSGQVAAKLCGYREPTALTAMPFASGARGRRSCWSRCRSAGRGLIGCNRSTATSSRAVAISRRRSRECCSKRRDVLARHQCGHCRAARSGRHRCAAAAPAVARGRVSVGGGPSRALVGPTARHVSSTTSPKSTRSHFRCLISILTTRARRGGFAPNWQRSACRLAATTLLIAGPARARGLIVATANTREFGRVAGLSVEDWAAA